MLINFFYLLYILFASFNDSMKEGIVIQTPRSHENVAKVPPKPDFHDPLKEGMVTQTPRSFGADTKIPIVIFPGLVSNSLFRDSLGLCGTDYRVWISAKLIDPLTNCWKEYMKLKYFPDTNTVADNIANIYVLQIGSTRTMENIAEGIPDERTKPFRFLVDKLVAAGFIRGETIYGIPYDWRRAVVDVHTEYYPSVGVEINKMINNSAVKKINMVCHSHGCINMAAFLIRKGQSWSKANINAIITLGSPWAGSVKSLQAFLSGDNFNIPAISINKVKDIQRTLTSLVHLFPSPKVFGDSAIFQLKTAAKDVNLSAEKLDQILQQSVRDPKIMRGRQNLTDYFDKLIEITDGIKKYCIYSVGRTKTIQKLVYTDIVDSSTLEEVLGNGDDTVNEVSLKYCDGKKDVESLQYSNVTHEGMLHHIPIIRFIIEKSIVKL